MNRSEEKRSKTVRGKLALGVVRQSFVSRSGSKNEPFVSSLAVIDATYVASQRSLTSPAFGRNNMIRRVLSFACVAFVNYAFTRKFFARFRGGN